MRTFMYRYSQQDERGAWSSLPSSGSYEQDLAAAKESGARKLTILSVSEVVRDDDTDKRNLKYKGPLYFDIDCKEDLYHAIRSGKTLVDRLTALGVDEADIAVYLSGSKGVHVLVDQRVFSSGRPIKRLPAVYKEIALSLFSTGMDMQVYCEGRGNSFRIPGVQRKDGNYRTRISYEELSTLTVERYQELAAQPRNLLWPEPKGVKSAELEELFKNGQRAVSDKQKERDATPDISAEDMALIATDTPPCIAAICEAKQLAGMTSFNQLAMQLASYLVKVGASNDRQNHLVDLLAKNGTSSAYTSESARKEHVTGVLRYAQSTKGLKFSCGAARATLRVNPCQGCKLREKLPSAPAAIGGIQAHPDGYFEASQRGVRQITNFTLRPVQVINERVEDGSDAIVRASIMMTVQQNGRDTCRLKMPESCWSSKTNFIRALEGYGVLAFLGNDSDIQKLKLVVLAGIEEIDEMTDVYTVGVHLDRRDGYDLFTYVEQGKSFNTSRVTGTHQLSGRVQAYPSLLDLRSPEPGDTRVQAALCNWLQSNAPEIMARVAGWFAACHIKEHIFATHNQFPLFNPWGNAGSGKSETVKLAQHINGVDPNTADCGPVNVVGITQFAILNYCASSNTVPRLVEEYNQSKMSQALYTYVGEIMKSAWNREVKLKGTLDNGRSGGRGGGRVQDFPISSPIAYVSEQQPKLPALLERTVSVKLSKNTKRGRDRFYNSAKMARQELRRFGKALMLEAVVNTAVEDTDQLYLSVMSLVPGEMEDRPRFGLQVVFAGLRFMRGVAEKLEFSEAVGLIDGLEAALHSELRDAKEDELFVQMMQPRSEIDNMLLDVALLISTADLEQGAQFEKGQHFATDGNLLMLNVDLVMYGYLRYCSSVLRQQPAISTKQDFMGLVRDEDYFDGVGCHQGVLGGKPFVKLNIDKMAAKGLDVSSLRAAK